ncbi:hypothetical protein ACVW2L_001462 [Mucilaginibacter sp. HD30]
MKAALKTADGTFELEQVSRQKVEQADCVVACVRVAGIWLLSPVKRPDQFNQFIMALTIEQIT